MRLVLETVTPDQMPYPTVGNWFFDKDGDIRVTVLEGMSRNTTLRVMVHELIEAMLCQQRNISEASVSAFDIAFENSSICEPGDSPDAPYRKEHQFATRLEHELAIEMGDDWTESEHEIEKAFAVYEDSLPR